MRQRTAGLVVLSLLGLILVGVLLWPPLWLFEPAPEETVTLSIHDETGTELATVDARIADSWTEQLVGLSRADSLENGSGMLFVHSTESTRGYTMENMSFSLDIIFLDSSGKITEIHHAPTPEDADGYSGPYEGRGKYVLETPMGWTNANGIAIGDTVDIPEEIG